MENAESKKSSMSAAEAAEILGVSYQSVLRAIRRGDLPALKFGKRKWLIAKESIEELMRKMRGLGDVD